MVITKMKRGAKVFFLSVLGGWLISLSAIRAAGMCVWLMTGEYGEDLGTMLCLLLFFAVLISSVSVLADEKTSRAIRVILLCVSVGAPMLGFLPLSGRGGAIISCIAAALGAGYGIYLTAAERSSGGMAVGITLGVLLCAV